MADNTIGFGKIYETTWWGIGVTTNTISWGKIYEDLASNSLAKRYEERVLAAGGIVESLECINNDI